MSDTVYIGFCQDIQKKPVDSLINTCTFAIKTYSPSNIHILFASGGGHIGLAFILYSFLKSLPVNIIMHGVANIDSCGVNVFLAGNERYAAANTTFMLHPSTTKFKSDVSLSINQLKLELATLQNDQEMVVDNIFNNTSLTKEQTQSYIQIGASFNSHQALVAGIISEIKEFTMLENCPFLQV